MWEAIAGIAAAVIGGMFSSSGQQSANETNIGLAQQNRNWMEQMSNTSYQRATADMSAAGLNPMLAYSQGGASTPTASAAQVANPRAGLGAGISNAASSASQAVAVEQGVQQISQSKAQTDQLGAQADLLRSQTLDKQLNTAQKVADIKQTNALADNTLEQILGTRYSSSAKQMEFRANMNQPEMAGTGFAADVQNRKNQATLSGLAVPEARAGANFYDSNWGKFNPYLNQMLKGLSGLGSAASIAGAIR